MLVMPIMLLIDTCISGFNLFRSRFKQIDNHMNQITRCYSWITVCNDRDNDQKNCWRTKEQRYDANILYIWINFGSALLVLVFLMWLMCLNFFLNGSIVIFFFFFLPLSLKSEKMKIYPECSGE